MEAALVAGAHYLDIAAAGPLEPGATPGVFAQLAKADEFKSAGRTALVSMGFDPGISNVMARDAAEPFEAFDAIRIRAGDLVSAGAGFLPLSSREAFLAYVLVRPTVWLGNELHLREPLREPGGFSFPSPRRAL